MERSHHRREQQHNLVGQSCDKVLKCSHIYIHKYSSDRLNQPNVITTTIAAILLSALMNAQSIYSQDMCPKMCICNDKNLEVRCNQPFGAQGVPHLLHPMTKRIIVNHAQTTHFASTDLNNYLQLELLDLAYNKISMVDFDYIKLNTMLNSLNASHNTIYELKDSAVTKALNESKFVDGVFNEQETFKSLKKSKINIVELSVSHNHLTVIRDYTFIRWHKLQRLDLSHNQLITFENNALSGLTRLEYINLRSNQFAQVPTIPFSGTIRSLTHSITSDSIESPLRVVDLSYNALVSLGANSFRSMGKVQELYLEHASIQFIDSEAFFGLNGLRSLSLDTNDLTDVPSDSFRHLSSLKYLNLNSNKMTTIQVDDFSHLSRLEEIHISNGKLQHLEEGALDKLSKLRLLNLHSNSLKTVPNSSSITTEPLTIVDLRYNHLLCDCDLKWLSKWLLVFNETTSREDPSSISSSNPSSGDNSVQSGMLAVLSNSSLVGEILNLTCTAPPALVGRHVSALPDNKLECLSPESDLNVHIGFLSLFLMTLVLTTICTVNFCRNEQRLMGILKENLVQSRLTMMMQNYETQGTTNSDKAKAETEFNSGQYEPVDYSHGYWPIYTISDDHQQQSAQNN